MDPLTTAGFAIQGISALSGLLGARGARKRAENARLMAISDLERANDQEYQNLIRRNSRGLAVATGMGGDAIRNLGSNLGAGLANAGVYNSSVVGGALAQNTADTQAQLSHLAEGNTAEELGLLAANRRYAAGMKFNSAMDQVNQARQDQQGAYQGFNNFLYQLPNVLSKLAQTQWTGGFDAANNGGFTTQNPFANGQLPGMQGPLYPENTPPQPSGALGASGMGRSVQQNLSNMNVNNGRSTGAAGFGMQNWQVPSVMPKFKPYTSGALTIGRR